MSKKITLPSGATVTLKEADGLKVKDRKRLMLAGDIESKAERGIAIGNAMLATLIEDWSYDLLIPSVKEDSIDELTIPDYVALMKETDSLIKEIFPDFEDTDENRANPDSPKENLTA
jgi:hypothetical protein